MRKKRLGRKIYKSRSRVKGEIRAEGHHKGNTNH